MGELVKKNFKKELSQLKKSVGIIPSIPTMPEFKTKAKGWGWIGAEHKVSGAEMNNFIVVLDDLLVRKNEWETKAYAEIKSIYETLDALDKEYIDGFMGTFNAVKKASEDSTCAIITLRDRISTQQKEISDLDQIRSNAQKGATALQPTDVPAWAKAEQKPTYTAEEIGALPKSIKISALQGYAEEHQGYEKLKRALIATSICTGTISVGALIALLFLIL